MRVDDLRVMAEREPIEVQEDVTHGEQTRTFLAVKFPLIDESGELYGVGGVATDITHHVRLEARLREAQRLEAVGQLAGGVAHDFNNLLAVISNYAAFVRKELPDDSRTAGDVDQIITASRRASELTRRLLLFSRRQSGTPEVLSLRRVIESLELLLHRTLGDDVDLTVDLDDRLWDVEADRSQLEQMLMSLAMNSREAMPDGGELRIEAVNTVMRDPASPSSRAVRLTVTDTGRGMAREVAAHAFEPFFTTKAVSGHGVGLGLATVYGIVTKARGRIEIDSEPGQGTTVTVTLPAVRRASDEDPHPSSPRGRGETVLVVEDADAVRVLTGRILYAAGYQVVSVESGAVALERLDAADVLVTDVVMPGMSGVELAVTARERRPASPSSSSPATPETPRSPDRMTRRPRFWRSPSTATTCCARCAPRSTPPRRLLVSERLQDVDPGGPAGGQRGGDHARDRGDDRHRHEARHRHRERDPVLAEPGHERRREPEAPIPRIAPISAVITLSWRTIRRT